MKKSNSFVPKVLNLYSYWGQIIKIVDGDTYDIEISCGFDIDYNGRFRLYGVDTPEKYGVKKDSEEYRKGVAATEFVTSLIPPGTWVEVRVSKSNDKYGRWIAEIFVDGCSLGDSIIAAGHGVTYFGGKR